jgi:lipoprotein-anchoring transpeptidase ErfK/SrfK
MILLRKRWWQIAAAIAAVAIAATLITQSGFFARSDVSLEIDLSDRRLDVIQSGEVVESYPIAVGSSSHPTPKGTYKISKIVWNPPWVPPSSDWARDEAPRAPGDPANPMQGVKIYFSDPAYFIHGTNDPASIGSAASHGCVRMETSQAQALARRLMEHGGATRADEWFEKVADNPRDTYVVMLPNSVSLEIDR